MASIDRSAVLSRLRGHQAELEAMGVRRLALFGSRARGDARATSEVDLGVAFDDGVRMGALAYFGHRQRVADRLAAILGTEVDLSDAAMQREGAQERQEAERVCAF
jgi:predicted nucleotidyltransferase